MAIGPRITSSMGSRLTLSAPSGEALPLDVDCGDLNVSGLLGKRGPLVTFSEYVSLDGTCSALTFLLTHSNVDIALVYESNHWGGGEDRVLRILDCMLEDVTFVESPDGNRLRFSLTGATVEGNMLPWAKPWALPPVSASGSANP